MKIRFEIFSLNIQLFRVALAQKIMLNTETKDFKEYLIGKQLDMYPAPNSWMEFGKLSVCERTFSGMSTSVGLLAIGCGYIFSRLSYAISLLHEMRRRIGTRTVGLPIVTCDRMWGNSGRRRSRSKPIWTWVAYFYWLC